MSKRESITRYSLIIKKLRKHPATFEEIADYLEMQSELEEYDFNISKRTFQRDLNDIREIYKIDIQYDRSLQHYYISEDEQPEINERILEAFATFNALNMSDRLSNDIHFEKRKSQGTEYLQGVLYAIRNRVKLNFRYSSFWEEVNSIRSVEPYAVKEFRNRWYLVGMDLKDNKIKTFGLDRVSDFKVSRLNFIYPEGFNVNDLYRHCFGIISPNAPKPHKIELWFNGVQGKYIKSLPLHESQYIISDTEEGLVIGLTLYLTYDFLMELLSYGGNVKVLKPEVLIEQIRKAHEEGYVMYE